MCMLHVCMCVGVFASRNQWASAIGRSGSAIAPIAYHVAAVFCATSPL